MSFNGTKTPTKPICKPKYIVPKKRVKNRPWEFYLTPELEKEFRRLYPITTNRRMMELFGISFSTMQRFRAALGLEKDMKVIIRKQAEITKRICEKNGYYDSIRGKRPTEQCFNALHEKYASGWHPMHTLKATNPRKYKRLMKARSEARKKLIAHEQKLIGWGMTPHTNLHLPQAVYSNSQINHRYNALKRGYKLGSKEEFSGERFTIFYDDNTARSPLFENNCIRDGFNFQRI